MATTNPATTSTATSSTATTGPADGAPPTGFVRETSPEAVARYLRARIVSGALRRDERVPRDEIARALGVSAVPVREAIIALDREGWLRIEPHRGAFVHGVDEDWIRDHYSLMGAHYALVAARAAERGSADERQRIAALGRELEAIDDVERFDAANAELMRALVGAARAPRVEAMLRSTPNIVPGRFFAEVPGTLEPQRRAMRAVSAAVERGDVEGAAAPMIELSAVQGRAVVAALRARGVLEG